MNTKLPSLLMLMATFLIGCASADLANDSSLNQSDRQLATRIAELSRERCVHYQYAQDTGQKLSGDMKFYATPVVKQLYRSDSGWAKAAIQSGGVWDNIYLLESSGAIICGEIGWQKFANANSIVFKEIGKSPSLLPTASGSNPTSTSQAAPRALEETRPMALSWDGYARLISGTVSLAQGQRRGAVRATLPGGEGSCTGIFEYASAKNGQWAVSCTNGLSATGTFEALGTGKGSSGIGSDIKGNKVEFTVGGSP